MVSITEPYLEHLTIHIVRVSPYQKFKAFIGGHPVLLNPRAEPYVFADPTFRKAAPTADQSFVSASDKYACLVILLSILLVWLQKLLQLTQYILLSF